MTNFGLIERWEGVSNGRPVLAGTGVCVEFVASRFAAGESIAELAHDYVVKNTYIEAALRLVLYARGVNINAGRAAQKIDAAIPLLHRLSHADKKNAGRKVKRGKGRR